MNRPMRVALLSALLLAALPGGVIAQVAAADPTPAWPAVSRQGATDVVAFSGGFVAVGANDKPALSKVWTSPDGQSWTRQDEGDGFVGAAMRRVAALGDGVVALGNKGRRLVAWQSPDGVEWLRYSIDRAERGMELFPEALTAGPTGVLAVASLIGQDLAGQRFYHSPDGQAWSMVASPPQTTGLFFSLEATPEEYLAVARPAFGPAEDLYWRSADGLNWETFAGPADGWLYDIAVGDDGTFIAVGDLQEAEDTLRPAIWRAAELGSWDLVHTYPSAKQTEDRLYRVEASGPGFVATGIISECPAQPQRSCPVVSILTSADGLEWQPLGIDDGVPGPLHGTEVNSIASDGETTVLLAWHEGPPNELWTLPPSP